MSLSEANAPAIERNGQVVMRYEVKANRDGVEESVCVPSEATALDAIIKFVTARFSITAVVDENGLVTPAKDLLDRLMNQWEEDDR